ncbi:uncharacterized protein JCM15063_003073 [Sporobolomyces koalae]|uniref:uncharacterized protein n=1 Tax=Sporobolomyces koalae TaxID=500713 RepID=UPI003171C508
MEPSPARAASPNPRTVVEPLPPTLLPTDPTLLSRYVRSSQLSALRHLYAYKTDQLAKESAAQFDATRGRGGRVRRRRGSSPTLDDKDSKELDEQDLLEVRKKFKWDPTTEHPSPPTSVDDAAEEAAGVVLGTAESLVSLRDGERDRRKRVAIDPVHTYDLVYDLHPDLSADAYYHGPHPEPPARVVRTVLRATRFKPFIDPSGLSSAQLEAFAERVWQQEGKSIAVNFGHPHKAPHHRTGNAAGGLTREEQRIQKEMNLDEQVEWEQLVISGFSATCHERIGQGMARKPMGSKEIQDHANHLHLQQQQQQHHQMTSQQQQQPEQPSSGVGTGATTTPTTSTPATMQPQPQPGPAPGVVPHMASQLPPQGYYPERDYQHAVAAGAHWR